ncbi:MAG: cytochrome c biogenesis CcdA family protein [Gammaproteobacteria bacterium]
MDADALQQAVAQSIAIAAGISFLAGFFFSFNPVALAAIPVSLAYVTKAREPRQALALGAMFILGMIATHVALGFAAALIGKGVSVVVGRYWGLILGPLLILLGLLWPGWIRIPISPPAMRGKRVAGMWGAFALGAPFSIAICPFCTPALLVLIGVAAATGSPLMGVTLLLAFALGRAAPIALGAWAIGWLESLRPLARYQRGFDVAGGITLIAAGLYMLNAYFFVVPALAG